MVEHRQRRNPSLKSETLGTRIENTALMVTFAWEKCALFVSQPAAEGVILLHDHQFGSYEVLSA